MRIRIKADMSNNVRIMDDDGHTLDNIVECDIKLRPLYGPEAVLKFILPDVEVHAKATVGEAHLRELAAAHGYTLVKKEELREIHSVLREAERHTADGTATPSTGRQS